MQIGDKGPTFSLPATDGTEHGPDGVTVVVFTCNHCPYALAWHDRLTRVARDYDVTFLAVNPNNAETHPRDSFDAMKKRVEADGRWPHPYPPATARAPASWAARTSSGVSPTSTAPVGSPYLAAARSRATATRSERSSWGSEP